MAEDDTHPLGAAACVFVLGLLIDLQGIYAFGEDWFAYLPVPFLGEISAVVSLGAVFYLGSIFTYLWYSGAFDADIDEDALEVDA